jgi:predicted anti-sigma-YlaC factor YlaD
MTCEQCSELLGDAVDGTLDADGRTAVDAHVRDCGACRGLLNDLMNIRAAAATLERRTPPPDVWRAISAHADHSASAPQRGRLTWLATAAALLMMLGTGAWFGLSREWRGGGQGATSELARSAASELQLAEQHYENAITALEKLTVDKDNALDPSVAAEIAQSLSSIDRAIDDSRAALKSEPDSFVAQTSLLEALRMKVALLQETVSLMNARS